MAMTGSPMRRPHERQATEFGCNWVPQRAQNMGTSSRVMVKDTAKVRRKFPALAGLDTTRVGRYAGSRGVYACRLTGFILLAPVVLILRERLATGDIAGQSGSA